MSYEKMPIYIEKRSKEAQEDACIDEKLGRGGGMGEKGGRKGKGFLDETIKKDERGTSRWCGRQGDMTAQKKQAAGNHCRAFPLCCFCSSFGMALIVTAFK